MAQSPVSTLLERYAGRLRFPQLFSAVAVLFVLDLLIPDLIPFADELLLGLLTLLLGSLTKPETSTEEDVAGDKPPMKDITPPSG